MVQREFDVIVFGASGFTGRLVAEYMDQQYGQDVRWAMAGRSLDKLAQVRTEMEIDESTALVAADSSDRATLKSLAARTKVVLTTVGPYQLYGTDMLAACVASGTDYVDLSGEPAWMRDMIGMYHADAEKSGAHIVHSCGFDSVPFDLGVYYLQQAAIERYGAPFSRVRGRVRAMQGRFSGGTAASFMATMRRAAEQPEILDWLKDPFSLCPGFDGVPQPSGHKPIYEADLKSWSAPFIMASINTKNIHRSNLLMEHLYGVGFCYDEMVLTGDGDTGKQLAEHMTGDNSMGENPPKPGEGPSKQERESGHYTLAFIGEKPNGGCLTAVVSGDKDPGYGSTSKMISECALGLAFDLPESVPGGVYTPAGILGETLIKRLIRQAGLSFRLEED